MNTNPNTPSEPVQQSWVNRHLVDLSLIFFATVAVGNVLVVITGQIVFAVLALIGAIGFGVIDIVASERESATHPTSSRWLARGICAVGVACSVYIVWYTAVYGSALKY